MGFSVLKAMPLCFFQSKPIHSTLLLRPFHSHPTSLFFTLSPSNPTIVSATPFAGSPFLLHKANKRGFRGCGIVAMAAPGSLQKSEEESRAILSPEQFRILRQRAPSSLEQENMTSSLVREFTTVLVVGLLSTDPQQNSILVVDDQPSMRVFPEP